MRFGGRGSPAKASGKERPTMKLGIIRNRCAEEDFAFVKGKGLDFIEVCLNFAKDSEGWIARKDEIAALIKKYDIPILSCGRWNGDSFPLDDAGNIRQEALDEAKRNIKVCSEIGCPVYHCGCNRVEGMSLFRNYEAAIKWFGTLIDFARPLGVKVSCYNCHWNSFIDNMTAWEIVLGELPELGIKFDASHSVSGGRDYMEEMRLWADRFYHVHVKGALRVNGQYVDDPPAGLDQLNWHAIIGMLYKAKYDGTLSIEPHSATWQGELGDRGIDLTIRYIRSLMV